VEFTYNNTSSSTTGFSSFFTNKGYHPPLDIQLNQASHPDIPHSDTAQYYSSNLAEIHTKLKQSITNAQNCYKKSADNRYSLAPKIDIGDHIFMLAKFIKTTHPSKKLSEKFLGPFEVSDKLGSHSYHVKLLHHLRAIHPVFHISQLEPALPNQIPNCTKNPPPSIELDGTLEFEVVQVLDSKFDRHRKDPLLYYVQ